VPECLVPIYALCSADYELKLADFSKKVIDYQSNRSSKAVTELMIQNTLMMARAVFESPRLEILSMLRTCRQALADQIVGSILKHNTYSMHVRTLSL